MSRPVNIDAVATAELNKRVNERAVMPVQVYATSAVNEKTGAVRIELVMEDGTTTMVMPMSLDDVHGFVQTVLKASESAHRTGALIHYLVDYAHLSVEDALKTASHWIDDECRHGHPDLVNPKKPV